MHRRRPAAASAPPPSITSTPLLGPIAGAMIQAVRDARQAVDLGDLNRLGQEAQRQELSLRMAELQARVAQELAIAERIENAVEVEIEEYYEGSVEGSLGFTPGPSGGTIGLGGSGRRVSKRVFRFLGARDAEPSSDAA